MTDNEDKGLNAFLNKLKNGKAAPLLQFFKFGLVGISNTAISYGIDMLGYYVLFANVGWDQNIKILVTNALAFFVSVTNSYYWNNRFVFRGNHKKSLKQHLLTYCKTVICYGATGLLLAPAIKMWLGGMGVPFWLSSLGTLIITIPLNFILNKFWAYRHN